MGDRRPVRPGVSRRPRGAAQRRRAFLTEAFRASGVLAAATASRASPGSDEVAGGSTGRKVRAVGRIRQARSRVCTPTCSSSSPATSTTRCATAERRRWSRRCGSPRCPARPDFPSRCRRAQFADYHRQTGTGILITERIRFGDNGIERQYHKCLDYEMPEPLEHYRALLTALARLAGTHRSGRLPGGADRALPAGRGGRDGGRAGTAVSADKLERRVTQLAAVRRNASRAAARQCPLTRVLGAPARRRAAVRAPRAGGRAPAGRRLRLCRAVPLERQHRQRVVLARRRRRSALRPDGLGMRRPDEHGHGDLGSHVRRRNRPVGHAISTNCCTCSSPSSIAAAARISIRIGCAGTRCSTRR